MSSHRAGVPEHQPVVGMLTRDAVERQRHPADQRSMRVS
jgi:hypothetical protein